VVDISVPANTEEYTDLEKATAKFIKQNLEDEGHEKGYANFKRWMLYGMD